LTLLTAKTSLHTCAIEEQTQSKSYQNKAQAINPVILWDWPCSLHSKWIGKVPGGPTYNKGDERERDQKQTKTAQELAGVFFVSTTLTMWRK